MVVPIRYHGRALSDHCLHNADIILREAPGPFTDLMGGVVSNPLYLLRAIDEPRYLEGARRNGTWLCEISYHTTTTARTACAGPTANSANNPTWVPLTVSAASRTFCSSCTKPPARPPGPTPPARSCQTLWRHAISDHGGLNWAPVVGETELSRYQWNHGAPGIGIVLLRAAQILDEASYRDTAFGSGRGHVQLRRLPQQYHPVHRPVGANCSSSSTATARTRPGCVEAAGHCVKGDSLLRTSIGLVQTIQHTLDSH